MCKASLLFGILVCAPGSAQTPTIDQSLGMQSVQSAEISPDGRYVAYTVQQTDWEDDEFVQQIWIAALSTGERYQLTSGKKSSQSPKWSPDSKRIAFAAARDSKRQIYLISPTGGEAAQLTGEDNGVDAFEWAPDASAIAYTSTGPEPKEKKDRKEKYGDFEIVNGDYSMLHLWLIKAPAEIPADPKQRPKAEALTAGDKFSVHDFSWSPDSKRIAFSATRDPDLGSSATAQIYVVNVADKFLKKLVEANGPHNGPVWSPDGRQIAFSTANGEEFYYYTNVRIAVVPADGGDLRVLTAAFDEDPRLVDWGPDGIYFGALQKTSSDVFRLNPATLAVERVSGPEQLFVTGATFTRDHRTMAGVVSGPGRFAEVFVSPVKDFAPKYLTNLSEQWKDFRLATREVIRWNSTDGTPIEGILIKPADYDASRKYPLLVVIHGGAPRGSILSGRAFCGQGSADPAAELSRIRRIRREVPRLECAQPGARRLPGRDFRRGFSNRQGHGRQGSRGLHGLERGRLYLGIHHHLQRPVQGGFGRRGNLGLGHLLREYRHPSIHAAISEGDSLGRSGDLSEDFPDLLCE